MKRTSNEVVPSNKRHKTNSQDVDGITQLFLKIKEQLLFLLDTNTADRKIVIYIKGPSQYSPVIATAIKNALVDTSLTCLTYNGQLCIRPQNYAIFMSPNQMVSAVNNALGSINWSSDEDLIQQERSKRKLDQRELNPWPCAVTYVLDEDNPWDPKVYLLMDTDDIKIKNNIYSILSQSDTTLENTRYLPVAGGLKNTELEITHRKDLYTIQLKDDYDLPENKTMTDLIEKYIRRIKGGEWNNHPKLVVSERNKRKVKWRDGVQFWNDKIEFIYDKKEQVVYVNINDEIGDEKNYVADLIGKKFRVRQLPLKVRGFNNYLQIEAKEEDVDITNIIKRHFWQRGKMIENPSETYLRSERIKRTTTTKTVPHTKKNTVTANEQFELGSEITFIVDTFDHPLGKIPVVFVKVDTSENSKINSVYGQLRSLLRSDKTLSCEIRHTEKDAPIMIHFKNVKEKKSVKHLKNAITKLVSFGSWEEFAEERTLDAFRKNIHLFGNINDHRWRLTNRSWNEMVVYTLDEGTEGGPWVYVTLNSTQQDDVMYAYSSFKQSSYPNSDTETHHGSLHNTILECHLADKFITISLKPGEKIPRGKSMMDIVNRHVFGGQWNNDSAKILEERNKRLQNWQLSSMFWSDRVNYIVDDFNPNDPAVYVVIKNRQIGDLEYARGLISRSIRDSILELETDGANLTIWKRNDAEFPEGSNMIDLIQEVLPPAAIITEQENMEKERSLRKPPRFKRWISSRSTVTSDDIVTYTYDNTTPRKHCVYVSINGNNRDFSFTYKKFEQLFKDSHINFALAYGYFILSKKNTSAARKESRTVDELVRDYVKYFGGKWDNGPDKLNEVKSVIKKRMSAERVCRYPHSQQKMKLNINWNEVVFKIVNKNPERPYLLVHTTNAENETRIMNALKYDLDNSTKLYMGKCGSLKKGDSGKMAIKLVKGVHLEEDEDIQTLVEECIRGGFYDQDAKILCVINWRFIQYTVTNRDPEDLTVKVTQHYPQLNKKDHRLRQDMNRICAALNLDLQRTPLIAELSNNELLIKLRAGGEIPENESIESIMAKFVRGGHWLVNGNVVQVWNGPRTAAETPREELTDILVSNQPESEEEETSQIDTRNELQFQREPYNLRSSSSPNISLSNSRYSFLNSPQRESEVAEQPMVIENQDELSLQRNSRYRFLNSSPRELVIADEEMEIENPEESRSDYSN